MDHLKPRDSKNSLDSILFNIYNFVPGLMGKYIFFVFFSFKSVHFGLLEIFIYKIEK
jgi:hypothetical protein